MRVILTLPLFLLGISSPFFLRFLKSCFDALSSEFTGGWVVDRSLDDLADFQHAFEVMEERFQFTRIRQPWVAWTILGTQERLWRDGSGEE